MDIQKLILESRKLNRDYDKRLSILRDASYDILNGNQLPYSEKDLKAFLLHVYTVEIVNIGNAKNLTHSASFNISDDLF